MGTVVRSLTERSFEEAESTQGPRQAQDDAASVAFRKPVDHSIGSR